MGRTTDRSSSPRDGVVAIVAAYLGGNPMKISEVPEFIRSVHAVLAELEPGAQPSLSNTRPARKDGPIPAVPIEQSVHDDYLVCLEDGQRLRMLKRYLMTRYGLTPKAYRERWGLPGDYSMNAPNLTRQRRTRAIANGFGRKPGE